MLTGVDNVYRCQVKITVKICPTTLFKVNILIFSYFILVYSSLMIQN